MEITTIGLDLAKSVFQVHDVDASGAVVRKTLRRPQVLAFFAKLPPCLVGVEACGTSHHWGRELMKLGHDGRLMPPAYVKPYVKRGKTDANDAEAICEAVTRPTMRFVAVKSPEQQSALALHRRKPTAARRSGVNLPDLRHEGQHQGRREAHEVHADQKGSPRQSVSEAADNRRDADIGDHFDRQCDSENRARVGTREIVGQETQCDRREAGTEQRDDLRCKQVPVGAVGEDAQHGPSMSSIVIARPSLLPPVTRLEIGHRLAADAGECD